MVVLPIVQTVSFLRGKVDFIRFLGSNKLGLEVWYRGGPGVVKKYHQRGLD